MNRQRLLIILTGLFALATLTQLQRLKQLASKLGPKWNNLHPQVRARALRVIEDVENDATFKNAGLKVGIFSGWRDVEKQLQEIREGDSFVKNPLDSYHTWGLAVDFVFINRFGQWTWLQKETDASFNRDARSNPRWQRLGALIKAQGFEWGGDFRTVFDGPHAQLPIQRVAALQAIFREPINFMVAENFGQGGGTGLA